MHHIYGGGLVNEKSIQTFVDTWGQAALLWQRLRRPIFEKEQLTQTDKRILYGLYRLKQATKKELAQHVVLEHSSLTRSLDRLEQKKLITRTSSQEDKRFVKLSLTQSGRAKTQSIKKQSLKLAKKLFSKISENKIKQATGTIKAFQQAMENMLENEITEDTL